MRVIADSSINFKGMAIGNGISNFDTNENSLLYFAYYHGLIGDRFVHLFLFDLRQCVERKFCYSQVQRM